MGLHLSIVMKLFIHALRQSFATGRNGLPRRFRKSCEKTTPEGGHLGGDQAGCFCSLNSKFDPIWGRQMVHRGDLSMQELWKSDECRWNASARHAARRNVAKIHRVPFFDEKAPMGAFSVKNGTRCIFATFPSSFHSRLILKPFSV